ncbi:SPOSA6832_04001, partial [Sporobolomyces salmonicolor]
MGSSRFLKTVRARHRQGALVVKLFVKPDPSLSLKPYHRRIKAERDALFDCPNVLPYARAVETERVGTRPFLSSVEKRWIAFQLLTGLKDARERGIAHGDIKTENVVVTSWNWAYLTDFSSAFKPTYLPLDDPSAFSFYFDTSSRRTCYIAPERFYSAGSDVAKKKDGLEFGKRDGKVTEAMDVFALGCVLAELWMEGTPPFTLSQLFKYREGEYNLEAYLAEIEDVEIRQSLIRSMISLDPSSRLSFSDYLSQYRTTAFPDIFYTFLHPFLSSLNDVSLPPPPPPPHSTPGMATPGEAPQVQQTLLRTEADERIERIWNEWEMIARYLDETVAEDRGKGKAKETTAGPGVLFPMRLHLPGQEGKIVESTMVEADGPALVILSLICTSVRNCVRPASVLRALETLLALNRYLTDETKLDRLVPYLVALLQDDVAAVRSAALRVLTQTLMLVTTITPSNVDVFPEYILPNTRPFSTDPEILPRTSYALCISFLAQTARRYLEMAEAMKTEGTFELANLQDFEGSPYAANFDTRLQELQSQIQEHINPLLSDPSSDVKRALLSHVGQLCTFFGRLTANDAVLAHLVTYLNTRDWLLRAAWNDTAVDVASCVGPRALEEYILPLIILSLSDPEEFVVMRVLASLTILAERRFLTKGKIWELVGQISGFLCHPNIWIREGMPPPWRRSRSPILTPFCFPAAASFLATVAKLLQPTDRWCIFYPTVKRLLRADVKDITDLALLDNAREPVSTLFGSLPSLQSLTVYDGVEQLPRVIFEAAVAWASRVGNSNFWSLSRGPTKGAPRDAGVRTDE